MTRLLRLLRRYLLTAVGSFSALSIGLTSRRGRRLLADASDLFIDYWKDEFVRRVPLVGPAALLSADEMRLVELPMADGNVTHLELFLIVSLIRHLKPMRLFEIGTFDGRTALNMAINAPEGATVFTLDLPKENTTQRFALHHRLEDDPYIVEGRRRNRLDADGSPESTRQRVVRLFGDSATFEYEPYEGTIDLVFVDGAHSYEYVLNDSEVALRLLRRGRGVILWHDFTNVDEVAKAVRRFRAAHKQVEVKRVVGTKLAYAVVGGDAGLSLPSAPQ